MGGGTGTGAAPVVAQVAKELGILTVAVVTKPFEMEGIKRMTIADQGIVEISKYVDSLITIPNEKLTVVLGSETTLIDAFEAANQVLQGAVQGISEIITQPGQINVDFADVRTVMSEMGMAMMGSGESSGEDRAREAAEAAISSPLLEDINLSGAKGILVNVTAGTDITIGEFKEVGDTIKEFSEKGANVVIGSVIDPGMKDNIRVTVVATGLGHNSNQAEIPMRVVKKEGDENSEVSLDYDKLNEPAIARKKAVGDGLKGIEEQEDLLNIPAFLRRQAD
jgi:cell division protein FtsZ